MRKAEEEELARPSREQRPKSEGSLPRPAERQPLRAVTSTWQEAETIPNRGIWTGEMPAGFPFPLGLQHLKEPLGVYPGHIASPLWSLRKGSLEQQHPDWEPALPAWHDGNASLLPLPYGVQRCPHPRELLMEVGEVNSSPHPSRSGLSTPRPRSRSS